MTPFPIIRDQNGTVLVGICLSQEAQNRREIYECETGTALAGAECVRVLQPRTRLLEPAVTQQDFLHRRPAPEVAVYRGMCDEWGVFAVEVAR
jgi:hypothetical protein